MALTTKDIPALLDSAWDARKDMVLCLLGKPGIGKTQQLYQFAEKKGAKVVEIIASQILPNEVSGITMPVNETHSMDVFDHARLSSLEDGDILFFDELLQASPQTLSACLTLIQERRMMSGKMLPDIMIVAAANHLSSATMIPMQIRQRFMFADIEWSFAAWKDYNQKKYGIKIGSNIKDQINFNDSDYNTLTPRTMSKLFAWRKSCGDDKAKLLMFKRYVEAEFGSVVLLHINELFTSNDAQTQIREALVSNFIVSKQSKEFIDILENIYDMSVKEIYQKLHDLPEWNEIEEVLSNTQFKQGGN